MACRCEHVDDGMGALAGVDGGECDKSFNFGVWPSDVDKLKHRLLLAAEDVDVGVLGCPELAAPERARWLAFMIEFRAFAQKETGIFGAYEEWTNACGYGHTIDGWREKLAKLCSIPGPDNVKGASTEGVTAIAWIAAAVIAVAVVVGVKGVIPPNLFGRRRK